MKIVNCNYVVIEPYFHNGGRIVSRHISPLKAYESCVRNGCWRYGCTCGGCLIFPTSTLAREKYRHYVLNNFTRNKQILAFEKLGLENYCDLSEFWCGTTMWDFLRYPEEE